MNSDPEVGEGGRPDEVDVTADNLKGLVHPLRVKLLGLLRTYGPATATSLAHQLGLTSGALSYHLRQLEKYGFIVEDASRGNHRERWWRAAHRSTAFDAMQRDSQLAGVAELEDNILAGAVESLVQARAAKVTFPAEWQRVFDTSDVLLRLTPDEANALSQDLVALLRRYRQHDPGGASADEPIGSRPVRAQFQIFPIADPAAEHEEKP